MHRYSSAPMPFDEDPDDEVARPDRLLPPDDRLWRHPSEIGQVAVAPGPPEPSGRSLPGRSVLIGACLAGALVAFGATWAARPTRVVERTRPTAAVRSAATTQAAVLTTSVPTRVLAVQLATSVVLVRSERAGVWSNSTGLWIDDDGTVVVDTPSVAGASTVIVVGDDEVPQTATVAGTDSTTGVTALVVDRTSGTPAEVATSPPSTGQVVAVVGANGTDAGDRRGEPTVAVVVVRSTDMRATVGRVVLHDAVEVDRSVPADAAGGAVVDAEGRLLAMVTGNTASRGVGAAAPAPSVVAAAKDLRAHGKVRRGWLGVRAVDVDPALATLLDIAGGARLTEVTGASPAATGGLEPDDVIVAIDEQQVQDASDLVNDLAGYRPGDRCTVSVRRAERRLDLPITLGG